MIQGALQVGELGEVPGGHRKSGADELEGRGQTVLVADEHPHAPAHPDHS